MITGSTHSRQGREWLAEIDQATCLQELGTVAVVFGNYREDHELRVQEKHQWVEQIPENKFLSMLTGRLIAFTIRSLLENQRRSVTQQRKRQHLLQRERGVRQHDLQAHRVGKHSLPTVGTSKEDARFSITEKFFQRSGRDAMLHAGQNPMPTKSSKHALGSWFLAHNKRARSLSCRERQPTSSGIKKIVTRTTAHVLGKSARTSSPGGFGKNRGRQAVHFTVVKPWTKAQTT